MKTHGTVTRVVGDSLLQQNTNRRLLLCCEATVANITLYLQQRR